MAPLWIRDIAGRDAGLPAWFEEGVATVIQREDALATETDALVARSQLANGIVTLAQVATLPDWHRTFARVGRPQYAVAALAVGDMETQVGQPGLVTALKSVGAGATFAQAYAHLGSGSLAAFIARFDAVKNVGAQIGVTPPAGPAGDLGWTIYAFPPNAEVRVHISGGHGYDLVFTVPADERGMFWGTSGSTTAAGPYTIVASTGTLLATAEMVNAR